MSSETALLDKKTTKFAVQIHDTLIANKDFL